MEEKIVLTILMATYNGDAFLEKQLKSIINQSYTAWELMIRDDGSDDDTLAIIENYCQKDNRIKLLNYGDVYGSACRNFSQLFDWAYKHHRNYILFADQDDIWLIHKLERSLAVMLKEEQLYGASTPLLLYSNLSFVDENDQRIPVTLPLPKTLDLPVLLNENYAWGCTIIINLAAIKKIQHIPISSINHDYYIAMVVAAFGKNILLNEHHILYRQHQKNVSGNVNKMTFLSRFNRYFNNSKTMLQPLLDNYMLVNSFYKIYKNDLTAYQVKMIGDFLGSYRIGFWPLLSSMFKHRIFKIGLGKNLMYIYTLYLLRDKVMKKIEEGGSCENSL
ncbi:glycosyltransferase family 2 protein [Pedobacter sp. Leaf250]|uniref:glycosyltransferase family 2 protein n=1 Tax=Pedobacter sp. Leaf250 TaxID=2876559 RepID=UPI001E604178|nr:glycosyltransferase family 2 protein [Pedobacter sp. Leaf250]